MDISKKIIITDYSDESLYSLMYSYSHNGSYVCHIRGELCSTVEDLFREISSGLRFPYYFGYNWPAFDECISDLEWISFSSLLIVLDHYSSVFNKEINANRYQELLSKHLEAAINYWESKEIELRVMFNR